jgi:hypothetical protein
MVRIPALERLFSDPPRGFSPTPLWWWSGGRVTTRRLRWQLERFAAGGVFNLVVINLAPAGPIAGARADDPAWFSDPWWDRFVDTCEIARELGMRIWFYDQIGFSGANVQGAVTSRHPTAAGHALRLRETRAPTEEFVAEYDRPGRRLVVTSVRTAFDYLSKPAVELLLDKVHHEFDRRVPHLLGNVIAGSFQDELPATNSWTPRFPAEFAARRGYDLLDHLPALWQGKDDQSAKVRGDYYAVRAELAEEALFAPLGRWHTERGMLLGSDQSNPARAGNPTQATQLYTDYFRAHRWYGAAGSDHEGDAKVHSSMAHLYGHERVWIEAFHSSGWGGTLEDTYDWLLPFLRSGANLYNPHASYYDTVGGWFEWAPPSTDWRQPYWRLYPAFARAVARITSIMSWGSFSAEVAVLHPTATAQALLTLDAPVDHFGTGRLGGQFAELDQTQADYLALCGANNWFDTKPGALDSAGIAFDVIDDASVQRAELLDGGLLLRDLRFTTVILPSASVLEEATARQLLRLLDAGGTVISVGRAPELAAGRGGDDQVVRRLAAHPRITRVAQATGIGAAIPTPGYAGSDVPLLVRRSGADAVALVTAAFPNASRYPLRTDTWIWPDYDFDPSRYAAVRTVTVEAPVSWAEIWNPVSGERHTAEVRVDGGRSHISVRLDGAPAALLVWHEGEPAGGDPIDPPAKTRPIRTDDLALGWSGELVPTMDNSWGDLALPPGADVGEVQIWTVDWAESECPRPGHGETAPGETSGWRPAKVTFGQRLRVHRPVPAREAPAPLLAGDLAVVLDGRAALADDEWETSTYSASRGVEKNRGMLGNKALVPEEFVRTPAPAAGEVAMVRALIRSDRPGAADLVIGAGSAKRIWWNGRELTGGDGYLATNRVRVDPAVNLLEYHLGQSENVPGFDVAGAPPTLGSFFALVAPDGFGSRPRFMTAGPAIVPDGQVTYQSTFDVPAAVESARLVVGAATGLTVSIDGSPVARQEKVEYYESSWGAKPMYFSHDVAAHLSAGRHLLRIVADSTDTRDVVFADLAIEHAQGMTTVVSGDGWPVSSGTTSGVSTEHRGQWAELASAHAAPRPHPLPDAEWLHGAPAVGTPVDTIHVDDAIEPATQWFRLALPAGTASVTLPLARKGEVTVAARHTVTDDVVRFAEPLAGPATLTVKTAPVSFDRGGAAWRGPVRIVCAPAPIELGDWREIGLRSWSGGVRYRRTVDLPSGAHDVVLDLGRVRGGVEVRADGTRVGETFCAPYRFPLGDRTGPVELEVTVYNTLAPFFDESTPTMWVFPSQLSSGMFGPIQLRYKTQSTD